MATVTSVASSAPETRGPAVMGAAPCSRPFLLGRTCALTAWRLPGGWPVSEAWGGGVPGKRQVASAGRLGGTRRSPPVSEGSVAGLPALRPARPTSPESFGLFLFALLSRCPVVVLL